MAIYQEDHRRGDIPSQVVGASLQPDSALDYPHRRSNTSSGSIVLMLWSLLLLLGILALLVIGPRDSPAFDTLTYVQGGPPTGANGRGWLACRRAGGAEFR